MNSNEIRKRFLSFFEGHGHRVVQSAALVPANDPTLFFTNAGMVQFKDVFTGTETRPYTRAASVQKCLRVSGKHNDLENVGRTPRHHTFFEMLGNFSFGDYFKEDAIRFAWTFLTDELGLDPDRLWVTVFRDDDEAFDLWRQVAHLPAERIQRFGEKENFWSMGDTGPCGPCSEIHYDHGPEHGPGGGPATESDRYVEIWNLVFMQYDRDSSGEMNALPRPSIDTGMGLERICAVKQGVYSNYDTDLFRPLIEATAARAGVTPGADAEHEVALRVIADHARATAFLVADGVMPSNEERGYVLRRLMRRAIRYGVKLGFEGPFLWRAVDDVITTMSDAWPELGERQDFVREVVRAEEERFAATLSKGLALLEREFERIEEKHGPRRIEGELAFKLYDTFGFPLDLTRLIAAERNVEVDERGYETHMAAQREAGRAAWKGSGEKRVSDVFHELAAEGAHTDFTGYTHDEDEGTVVAIVRDGKRTDVLPAGATGRIVTDRTPFYAESGGQVGDRGEARGPNGRFVVTDTTKPADDIFVHEGKVVEGTIRVGDRVRLIVDASRRDRIRLNHTATHLLHAALRQVLGEHVLQKGSLVAPDRLRFDFSHVGPMTPEQIARVEDLVYGEVLRNSPVVTQQTSFDEARKAGAMALFGEKYGERVRMVQVPGFSTELCGGTHARRTGDIGLFRIVSESGVAAGVRRIEALTGPAAMEWVRARDTFMRRAAEHLRTTPDQLADAVARLSEERKRLERELDEARRELARAKAGDLAGQAREVDGLRVLAAEFSGDPKTLRDEADRLRDQLAPAVVVLGTREGGAVRLVATVSKEIAGKRVHAGKLIQQIAGMVGGGGGGRPDMAQAGGRNPDALPNALEAVYKLVDA